MGDLKCGVYARAQKRAKNYKTFYSGGDGTTAQANYNVLKAFVDGAAALTANDPMSFSVAAQAIMGNTMTVYIQASLRYLYLLDKDVAESLATSDHQGEGRAFWQTIEPFFKAIGPGEHFDKINVYYDLKVAPTGGDRYCTGKEYFYSIMPEGVTKEMIGTFEYDAEADCLHPDNDHDDHDDHDNATPSPDPDPSPTPAPAVVDSQPCPSWPPLWLSSSKSIFDVI